MVNKHARPCTVSALVLGPEHTRYDLAGGPLAQRAAVSSQLPLAGTQRGTVQPRPASSRACRSQAVWSIGAFLIPSVPTHCEPAAEDSRLIPPSGDVQRSLSTEQRVRLRGGRVRPSPQAPNTEFRAFCPPAPFLVRDIPLCSDSPT